MDESKCEGVRETGKIIQMLISLFRQRDLFRIQIMNDTIFTYDAKYIIFMF